MYRWFTPFTGSSLCATVCFCDGGSERFVFICWCCSSNFIFFLHFKDITVCPMSAVYSSYIDWCAFPNTEMILCWLKQVSPVSMSPTVFSSICWCCCFYQKWRKAALIVWSLASLVVTLMHSNIRMGYCKISSNSNLQHYVFSRNGLKLKPRRRKQKKQA